MELLLLLLLSYLPAICHSKKFCKPKPKPCPTEYFRASCSSQSHCFRCVPTPSHCHASGLQRVGCNGDVGDRGSCKTCRKDQYVAKISTFFNTQAFKCKDCAPCPPGQERVRCTLVQKKTKYLLDSGLSLETVCTKPTDCGGKQPGMCTACPKGKFKSESSNLVCQDCSPCLQPYLYREGCGGNSPGQCVLCTAIEGCDTFSLTCTSTEGSSCTNCSAGFFGASERPTTTTSSARVSTVGVRLVNASGSPAARKPCCFQNPSSWHMPARCRAL